jgi:hypothetical protein
MAVKLGSKQARDLYVASVKEPPAVLGGDRYRDPTRPTEGAPMAQTYDYSRFLQGVALGLLAAAVLFWVVGDNHTVATFLTLLGIGVGVSR